MALTVGMIVQDRPFLEVRSEPYTGILGPTGHLLIKGDDGESISIQVGSPEYTNAIADFINKLSSDVGTQLRASLRLMEAAE